MKGLLAEKLFDAECTRRKIKTLKPTDPKSKYDIAIDIEGKIFKVQIKSTSYFIKRKDPKIRYGVKLVPSASNRLYLKSEVDLFAIYIEPLNIWYLIPYDNIGEKKRVTLYPYDTSSLYDPYQNAWYILDSLGEGE